MRERIYTLILGSSENGALLLIEELRRGGYDPDFLMVDEVGKVAKSLVVADWDIIISDSSFSKLDVSATISLLNDFDKRIPLIVVSEDFGVSEVVDLIKSGVSNYIPKGELHRLLPAIKRGLNESLDVEDDRSTDFDLEERNKMMMSILEDVESLHNAAEKEREKLYLAISAMDEAILLFDVDKKVVLHNGSASRLFGGGADSEITVDVLSKYRWFPLEEIENVLSGADRFDVDIIISKEPFSAVNLTSVPIGGEGFLVTISDITKERELIRAKDDLITTVSHELRTPLTMIKLFFANAIAGVMGEQNEKMRRAIDRANTSVLRLATLIDELLDYSRFERGAVQVSIQSSFVGKIVNELSILFNPIADSKNRKFKVRVDVGDEEIDLDEHRIHQVLSNLIDNAIKFTGDGGHIELLVKDDDEGVSFMVIDDGEGVAPQFLETIFDRFKQVGRTYGPGIKGLGLGLAICREIVEAHNGRIWAESELGKGSKFIVRLPRSASSVGDDAQSGKDEWTLS